MLESKDTQNRKEERLVIPIRQTDQAKQGRKKDRTGSDTDTHAHTHNLTIIEKKKK